MNNLKNLKFYHWTFIYCIAVLILNMTPLAWIVSFYHLNWILFFLSIPVGFIGAVAAFLKKNVLFIFLNLIGAGELYFAILLLYLLFGY